MKLIKRLLIGIVVLILLLVIVLTVVVSTLDLNQYKSEIQELVKEQTGRDLAINGDIGLSFYPWVGASIGQLELANAEGFGEQPFAKIDAANVKVEVLPLLKKEVNVGAIELDGLALDLQKQSDGKTNWDDLVQPSAAPGEDAGAPTATETGETDPGTGEPPIAALAVNGITISNANISWNDAQGGTDAKLQNFNLTTGAVKLGEAFPLEIGFDAESQSFAVKSRLDLSGEITADLENQKYSLMGLKMAATAEGEGVPIKDAGVELGGDISADLNNQVVDVANLALSSLGIALSGNVNVTNLNTDPQIDATLASQEPFSLRELFAKLEIEPPVTADEAVMNTVSLSMNLKASTQHADMTDLTIKLDDTTFKGQASVPDLAGDLPPVRFNFNVDDIDLDRYLPPVPETPEETTTTEESTEAATTQPAAEDIPIELPLELMRKLDIIGEFSLDNIKVSNLVAKNIVVPLTAKDGLIKLEGIGAQMYDGDFTSNVALDAKTDTADYAVGMDLQGILAEPLLKDFLQDDAPLSGKGNFNLDITTAGNSVNALKGALNGGYGLSFVDGAINGVNIGYQIRRAEATIKGQKLEEDEEFKRTDFSALTMTGKFTDGVLYSDDLDMRAPALRLEGVGTVDLPKEYVDYKLKTGVGGTSEGQGGRERSDITALKIAVPIRGHFNELSADFTGAIVAAMREDLQRKVDEAKAKAEARLKAEEEKLKLQLKQKEDEAKAELKKKQDEAKAKLKEKEKEELKKLEEKAKDKLKDKLKGLF